MKKRIGCLHAHYSNIELIERALAGLGTELVHYVDPGLVHRITSDPSFRPEDARKRVKEQVEWIGKTGVDAILMTCTNYIAVLQEEPIPIDVPIVNIDEPFFETVCRYEGPQLLLFTNPATVDGTMGRLRQFAQASCSRPNVEFRVLNGLFELVMQGKKEQHDRELFERLRDLVTLESRTRLSVAQLSMATAADRVRAETGVAVGHALASLYTRMEQTLSR